MTPPTTGRERKVKRSKPAARPAARKKAAPARAAKPKAAAPEPARKRSSTAADVDVDADVLEFIEALDRYKKAHNKPFPSWSEVLHVLRGLGYRKHG